MLKGRDGHLHVGRVGEVSVRARDVVVVKSRSQSKTHKRNDRNGCFWNVCKKHISRKKYNEDDEQLSETSSDYALPRGVFTQTRCQDYEVPPRNAAHGTQTTLSGCRRAPPALPSCYQRAPLARQRRCGPSMPYGQPPPLMESISTSTTVVCEPSSVSCVRDVATDIRRTGSPHHQECPGDGSSQTYLVVPVSRVADGDEAILRTAAELARAAAASRAIAVQSPHPPPSPLGPSQPDQAGLTRRRYCRAAEREQEKSCEVGETLHRKDPSRGLRSCPSPHSQAWERSVRISQHLPDESKGENYCGLQEENGVPKSSVGPGPLPPPPPTSESIIKEALRAARSALDYASNALKMSATLTHKSPQDHTTKLPPCRVDNENETAMVVNERKQEKTTKNVKCLYTALIGKSEIPLNDPLTVAVENAKRQVERISLENAFTSTDFPKYEQRIFNEKYKNAHMYSEKPLINNQKELFYEYVMPPIDNSTLKQPFNNDLLTDEQQTIRYRKHILPIQLDTLLDTTSHNFSPIHVHQNPPQNLDQTSSTSKSPYLNFLCHSKTSYDTDDWSNSNEEVIHNASPRISARDDSSFTLDVPRSENRRERVRDGFTMSQRHSPIFIKETQTKRLEETLRNNGVSHNTWTMDYHSPSCRHESATSVSETNKKRKKGETRLCSRKKSREYKFITDETEVKTFREMKQIASEKISKPDYMQSSLTPSSIDSNLAREHHIETYSQKFTMQQSKSFFSSDEPTTLGKEIHDDEQTSQNSSIFVVRGLKPVPSLTRIASIYQQHHSSEFSERTSGCRKKNFPRNDTHFCKTLKNEPLRNSITAVQSLTSKGNSSTLLFQQFSAMVDDLRFGTYRGGHLSQKTLNSLRETLPPYINRQRLQKQFSKPGGSETMVPSMLRNTSMTDAAHRTKIPTHKMFKHDLQVGRNCVEDVCLENLSREESLIMVYMPIQEQLHSEMRAVTTTSEVNEQIKPKKDHIVKERNNQNIMCTESTESLEKHIPMEQQLSLELFNYFDIGEKTLQSLSCTHLSSVLGDTNSSTDHINIREEEWRKLSCTPNDDVCRSDTDVILQPINKSGEKKKKTHTLHLLNSFRDNISDLSPMTKYSTSEFNFIKSCFAWKCNEYSSVDRPYITFNHQHSSEPQISSRLKSFENQHLLPIAQRVLNLPYEKSSILSRESKMFVLCVDKNRQEKDYSMAKSLKNRVDISEILLIPEDQPTINDDTLCEGLCNAEVSNLLSRDIQMNNANKEISCGECISSYGKQIQEEDTVTLTEQDSPQSTSSVEIKTNPPDDSIIKKPRVICHCVRNSSLSKPKYVDEQSPTVESSKNSQNSDENMEEISSLKETIFSTTASKITEECQNGFVKDDMPSTSKMQEIVTSKNNTIEESEAKTKLTEDSEKKKKHVRCLCNVLVNESPNVNEKDTNISNCCDLSEAIDGICYTSLDVTKSQLTSEDTSESRGLTFTSKQSHDTSKTQNECLSSSDNLLEFCNEIFCKIPCEKSSKLPSTLQKVDSPLSVQGDFSTNDKEIDRISEPVSSNNHQLTSFDESGNKNEITRVLSPIKKRHYCCVCKKLLNNHEKDNNQWQHTAVIPSEVVPNEDQSIAEETLTKILEDISQDDSLNFTQQRHSCVCKKLLNNHEKDHNQRQHTAVIPFDVVPNEDQSIAEETLTQILEDISQDISLNCTKQHHRCVCKKLLNNHEKDNNQRQHTAVIPSKVKSNEDQSIAEETLTKILEDISQDDTLNFTDKSAHDNFEKHKTDSLLESLPNAPNSSQKHFQDSFQKASLNELSAKRVPTSSKPQCRPSKACCPNSRKNLINNLLETPMGSQSKIFHNNKHKGSTQFENVVVCRCPSRANRNKRGQNLENFEKTSSTPVEIETNDYIQEEVPKDDITSPLRLSQEFYHIPARQILQESTKVNNKYENVESQGFYSCKPCPRKKVVYSDTVGEPPRGGQRVSTTIKDLKSHDKSLTFNMTEPPVSHDIETVGNDDIRSVLNKLQNVRSSLTPHMAHFDHSYYSITTLSPSNESMDVDGIPNSLESRPLPATLDVASSSNRPRNCRCPNRSTASGGGGGGGFEDTPIHSPQLSPLRQHEVTPQDENSLLLISQSTWTPMPSPSHSAHCQSHFALRRDTWEQSNSVSESEWHSASSRQGSTHDFLDEMPEETSERRSSTARVHYAPSASETSGLPPAKAGPLADSPAVTTESNLQPDIIRPSKTKRNRKKITSRNPHVNSTMKSSDHTCDKPSSVCNKLRCVKKKKRLPTTGYPRQTSVRNTSQNSTMLSGMYPNHREKRFRRRNVNTNNAIQKQSVKKTMTREKPVTPSSKNFGIKRIAPPNEVTYTKSDVILNEQGNLEQPDTKYIVFKRHEHCVKQDPIIIPFRTDPRTHGYASDGVSVRRPLANTGREFCGMPIDYSYARSDLYSQYTSRAPSRERRKVRSESHGRNRSQTERHVTLNASPLVTPVQVNAEGLADGTLAPVSSRRQTAFSMQTPSFPEMYHSNEAAPSQNGASSLENGFPSFHDCAHERREAGLSQDGLASLNNSGTRTPTEDWVCAEGSSVCEESVRLLLEMRRRNRECAAATRRSQLGINAPDSAHAQRINCRCAQPR